LAQEDLKGLSLALSEMMISDLSSLQILTLVEREEINKIIEEQKLSLSGMIDSSSAAKAGELLGARYLMSGRVTFTSRLVSLNSRISDVESGEVLASVSKNGSAEDLFILQEELLEDLMTQWDIPLSRKEWDLLAQRDNVSLNGLIQFGNALQASDEGDYEQAMVLFEKAVDISPDFQLAVDMLSKIRERFDQFIERREQDLPVEILDRIDDLAEGDSKAEQDVQKMYQAFVMPMMTALSYYGSWASLDKNTQDYFFEQTIKPSWAQTGLPREPENMEEVEDYLGRRIYKAQQILEYMLKKDLPMEGFNPYLHPVEGMTGYFLMLFASLSSMPDWQIPPMINGDGEVVARMDEYYTLLLRYCDMFITNFPYSSYGSVVTPMMQVLIEKTR